MSPQKIYLCTMIVSRSRLFRLVHDEQCRRILLNKKGTRDFRVKIENESSYFYTHVVVKYSHLVVKNARRTNGTNIFVIPPNSNTFSDWRRTCHVSLVKTS